MKPWKLYLNEALHALKKPINVSMKGQYLTMKNKHKYEQTIYTRQANIH